ncbi:UNVERIFIED_CONTAM: hypothetical protein HDU68_009900 [Siphonaria sp. JEL0065]|nr:hypothetical protein HDU68_009900 [Siphonaria sp. JEL0065]
MTVTIYYSELASTIKAKKDASRMCDRLTIHKIEFAKVDVSVDELSGIAGCLVAKAFLKAKSPAKPGVFPLIFVNDEYKGTINEVEEANENGELAIWLGV